MDAILKFIYTMILYIFVLHFVAEDLRKSFLSLSQILFFIL